ncbi:CBS domain-containing protein [Thermococcus celer]|uniref:CBS domain-containing protein n=1 Tax=Thermococcus celer Vu 13 = JCM 8558 TaxID=1293037 RepID=A0A218P472_THECE|nr:CBS domain-containing protein [Thermococcus celer]ASI99730.1 CBS domain-containing protein [Thermococcus celer Vu 13 = JCM 8558]
MEVESALEILHSIKLADIMPSIETMPVVTADTDIINVLKILRSRHHVWVVDDRENRELVGVIRYLDVMDLLLPPEAHRFKLGMTSNTMRSILGGATRAGDVAERQVLTIEEDATVLDALMKMRKYRIQVLAVVKDGKLVGEMSLRILIDELLRLLRVGGAQWKR